MDEYRSKQFLKDYGIPVVPETVARNAEAVEDSVRRIGFPVVVKGLGARLSHKTERGLVRLNLMDMASVADAVRDITNRAGKDLEGFLVQPLVTGRREFVAGLIRDPQFGPVVMFGLGGVFTEALTDVAFRVAPLTAVDAEEMVAELKASTLLGAYRGEAAVNREQLTATLLGLSRMAMAHPEIMEVDVNPLIVTPKGEVCAVDGLVVSGDPIPEKGNFTPIDPERLAALFYPENIAFVGASGQFGKWGHMLVVNTVSQGYAGGVYLVNPKGEEIFGQRVYRSVVDIPGPVGLAVVTIPAAGVMDLIPQFVKKGIRHMLLISSGFSEAGAAGQRLEARLVREARKAGILVLGPNTMGISNPHIRLYCTGAQMTPRAGETAIIAQSGNMGAQLMAFAARENIGIRAYCGSGNEAMISIEDYMAAFARDKTTRTVVMYIEGVKDGRRFLEVARDLTRRKPAILLKGGRSGAGNRAAASHTGSMAADIRLFDAACRQAGVVTVTQPMDLLDQAAGFSALPLPRGNRVAVMTSGGGWGVVTADLCSDYGLEMPALTEEILAQLDTLLPSYWSRSNPVDLVGEQGFDLPMTILESLVRWEGCDAVIHLGINDRWRMVRRLAESTPVVDSQFPPDSISRVTAQSAQFETAYVAHVVKLMETFQKPICGVSLFQGEGSKTIHEVDGARYKGVFFKTPEQAVKTIAKMAEYQRFIVRRNHAFNKKEPYNRN